MERSHLMRKSFHQLTAEQNLRPEVEILMTDFHEGYLRVGNPFSIKFVNKTMCNGTVS